MTVYIYDRDVIVHADDRTAADAIYEEHTGIDLDDYCECCGPDVTVAELTIEEWATECQEDWNKRNIAGKEAARTKPLLELAEDELRPLRKEECDLRDRMRPLEAKIDGLSRRLTRAMYTLNTTTDHDEDTHLGEETTDGKA